MHRLYILEIAHIVFLENTFLALKLSYNTQFLLTKGHLKLVYNEKINPYYTLLH